MILDCCQVVSCFRLILKHVFALSWEKFSFVRLLELSWNCDAVALFFEIRVRVFLLNLGHNKIVKIGGTEVRWFAGEWAAKTHGLTRKSIAHIVCDSLHFLLALYFARRNHRTELFLNKVLEITGLIWSLLRLRLRFHVYLPYLSENLILSQKEFEEYDFIVEFSQK